MIYSILHFGWFILSFLANATCRVFNKHRIKGLPVFFIQKRTSIKQNTCFLIAEIPIETPNDWSELKKQLKLKNDQE